MTTKIDSPVSVSIRPASGQRAESVTLDTLGGSMWFLRTSCPASLTPGMHKGAEVEVSLRTFRIGEHLRSVFVPVRLVSVL